MGAERGRRWVSWFGLSLGLVVLPSLVGGCEDESGPLRSPCGALPEWTCLQRSAGPCSPLASVQLECRALAWTCPEGSTVRQAVEPPEVCAPAFRDFAPKTLGPLVPDGDRCLMLVNGDVTAGLGPDRARTVILPDPPLLGACDLGVPRGGPGWVHRGGLDRDDIVDVNDVVQTPAATYAVHRLFRRAPEMVFGAQAVGASLVQVAAYMPAPKPPAWPGHGYRSLAAAGDWLYMFDCFGAPDFLLEDCGVLRAPLNQALEPDAFRSLNTNGEFVRDPVDRQVVFRAGPQHHVAYHPGLRSWLMTSVGGFGDTIFVRAASTPDGPWLGAVDVHKCKLPSDDPDPFCDSARLVPALFDPERPSQVVLTYRVDSTAPDREARIEARPSAYWPQMVWVDVRLSEDELLIPPG